MTAQLGRFVTKGETRSWRGHEELEGFFNDFLFALTFPGAFDAQEVEARGPRWKRAQTILSGSWHLLRLRYSNPFLKQK